MKLDEIIPDVSKYLYDTTSKIPGNTYEFQKAILEGSNKYDSKEVDRFVKETTASLVSAYRDVFPALNLIENSLRKKFLFYFSKPTQEFPLTKNDYETTHNGSITKIKSRQGDGNFVEYSSRLKALSKYMTHVGQALIYPKFHTDCLGIRIIYKNENSPLIDFDELYKQKNKKLVEATIKNNWDEYWSNGSITDSLVLEHIETKKLDKSKIWRNKKQKLPCPETLIETLDFSLLMRSIVSMYSSISGEQNEESLFELMGSVEELFSEKKLNLDSFLLDDYGDENDIKIEMVPYGPAKSVIRGASYLIESQLLVEQDTSRTLEIHSGICELLKDMPKTDAKKLAVKNATNFISEIQEKYCHNKLPKLGKAKDLNVCSLISIDDEVKGKKGFTTFVRKKNKIAIISGIHNNLNEYYEDVKTILPAYFSDEQEFDTETKRRMKDMGLSGKISYSVGQNKMPVGRLLFNTTVDSNELEKHGIKTIRGQSSMRNYVEQPKDNGYKAIAGNFTLPNLENLELSGTPFRLRQILGNIQLLTPEMIAAANHFEEQSTNNRQVVVEQIDKNYGRFLSGNHKSTNIKRTLSVAKNLNKQIKKDVNNTIDELIESITEKTSKYAENGSVADIRNDLFLLSTLDVQDKSRNNFKKLEYLTKKIIGIPNQIDCYSDDKAEIVSMIMENARSRQKPSDFIAKAYRRRFYNISKTFDVLAENGSSNGKAHENEFWENTFERYELLFDKQELDLIKTTTLLGIVGLIENYNEFYNVDYGSRFKKKPTEKFILKHLSEYFDRIYIPNELHSKQIQINPGLNKNIKFDFFPNNLKRYNSEVLTDRNFIKTINEVLENIEIPIDKKNGNMKFSEMEISSITSYLNTYSRMTFIPEFWNKSIITDLPFK